ncbi:PREDICTED: pentatricopeptide repeat-containing protein At3g62890-like [Nelumbo nucifera]|nr:PREDICTED: pentatricopeptide repeat-containing protein At3g62890-like [Nelumbo nucifera]
MAALLSSPSQGDFTQTIMSFLRSCSSLKQAKQIHACILRNNLPQYLYAKLLLFCTSSSPPLPGCALDYATLVFVQLQQEPTIFMWNTMIRSHARNEDPLRALSFYIRMRDRCVEPNNYTFTFLVKACTTDSCLFSSIGRAFHAQSIVFGIPNSDIHLYTSLVNMYSSTVDGDIAAARSLFDRMKHRTTATWNAMIAGYARQGDIEAAKELFDKMPDNEEQYFQRSKFGDVGRLFASAPVKTLSTWNSMIAGCVRASKPAEALAIFHQMQLACVRPNEVTVVSVLPACAQLGALESGEWIHLYVERNRLDNNISVCNAIIDMYSKCGCIEKATAMFKGMKKRNVVSWNTMISGLAIHGRAEEAIELFTKMESEGVMPDEITFVGLLNAFAHAGVVDKAWVYFQRMQKIYGIEPKIEHYGCMIDVLGRACHLDEALNLINQMSIEPNAVILGSLLSACRNCNNLCLGEKVLKKLVELEPLNSGYYVLLSNIYASARQWKDVNRVREWMKCRGIEKIPGCSSIEIDNTVHEFIVGDKTHSQTQDIYAKLDEIYQKLESAGYVPDASVVLFDLDEEEKAQNLLVHSERLAIAFGLLKLSTNKPIRVVKNLRVCRDCHLAIKLMSQVYGREIVLRDCNRFHHFRDGRCSCNDFW